MTRFTITWAYADCPRCNETHTFTRDELETEYPHFAAMTEHVNGLDDFSFVFKRNAETITITAHEVLASAPGQSAAEIEAQRTYRPFNTPTLTEGQMIALGKRLGPA
jgi:hypothetical protein